MDVKMDRIDLFMMVYGCLYNYDSYLGDIAMDLNTH